MNKYLLSFILTLFYVASFGQHRSFTISGYVKDKETGETLLGAPLTIKELGKSFETNMYGYFSFTLKEGIYTLKVSPLGYTPYNVALKLHSNAKLNIELKPKVYQTREVVITGERLDKNVQSTSVGTTTLQMDKVKTLPAFMGEVDILKTIQLLPGVQNAGEGNTGLYVRGGGPDQNLILLDEATVYNASHLFGFFSIFNGDAIKNVTLIKGGMPAVYGGRLASVLDINMKEGNTKTYHGEGGIGLIASRFTFEGPVQKNKSSFIVSGRRTYIDLLTKPFISKSSKYYGSGYYFYDLNAKMNYIFSDKDRLYLSGYMGKDVFTYNNNSSFSVKTPWGNSTASARYNHVFAPKLFMNATAIFTDYNFSTEISQSDFSFKLISGIRDWNGKLDFTYFPTIRHNIRFGTNYTFHTFTPSSVSAKTRQIQLDPKSVLHQYANEYALYIQDDYDLTEKVKINGGLRYSAFQDIGPYDRYEKDFQGNVNDTIHYAAGKSIKFYQGIEPRFSIRYALNLKSSIKASYTHNYQYIHLTSFASISLPTDIWVPSSYLVKPQIGNQYSIGYFRNFNNNDIETSAEVYYKDMKNLVEYKDGTQPNDNINDNVENNLTFGTGKSYGLELFVKKNFGKFNGWVGYTLSYTTRLFQDLNNGVEFYPRYDRRHDASVVLTYEINKKFTASMVFVYATGNAITLPVSRYFINGRLIEEYGPRGWYRMEAYHRMDVSLTYFAKKTEKFESSFNLSIYNVYDHRNPYFIYFDQTGSTSTNDLKLQAKQVALFPILPSLSWNFKF